MVLSLHIFPEFPLSSKSLHTAPNFQSPTTHRTTSINEDDPKHYRMYSLKHKSNGFAVIKRDILGFHVRAQKDCECLRVIVRTPSTDLPQLLQVTENMQTQSINMSSYQERLYETTEWKLKMLSVSLLPA